MHADADPVNTAARLAGKARKRGTRVMCSEAIQSPLMSGSTFERGRILLTPAGSVELKGKLLPVPVFIPVFSMVSVRDQEIEAFNLVGRLDAIALLEGFVLDRNLRDVGNGGPKVLVVEGSMGMGKSTLLNVMEHDIIPRYLTVHHPADGKMIFRNYFFVIIFRKTTFFYFILFYFVFKVHEDQGPPSACPDVTGVRGAFDSPPVPRHVARLFGAARCAQRWFVFVPRGAPCCLLLAPLAPYSCRN
jgi:hypothetical protein